MTMASKEECDRYASELTQRFEEFTKWAIANWPKKEFPLLPSDFSEARREISEIVGPKLGEGENDAPGIPAGTAQYRDVNPMPWP
ncbi:hypothetical protein [Noviherbaspirillum sp. UKPF54]|uniref:hypothetical protein n=1 Tax=Noviherbaspirillum sp. UKPF54 TaxID=2601898 RepID=UPI0011B10574|nr:hypothetical protein [Noviherbaspirillum sp. UKPF54]QDZ28739.1 hypothetical protein FAY22_12735 [Noviherbaspirillum sp. UKPF54]